MAKSKEELLAKLFECVVEMEEDENGLHVVNEVTGNWFHAAGGHAKGWVYEKPCVDIPSFAKDPRG